MDILARQKLLRTLKATLEHLHRIHLLSQTIDSAQESTDHAEISRACILFESLTVAHPLFNPEYKCLQPISDRVALRVAHSMRFLRTSLRVACRNFDPTAYEKCMTEFYKLGAAKQFVQHVVQVFEEEARSVYDDAIALDAHASQKVISFFSMISGLVGQFLCVVRFHSSKNEREEGVKGIRREVGGEFLGSSLPFEYFGRLVVKILQNERVPLLTEQTTSLLHVFDAARRFYDVFLTSDLRANEILEGLKEREVAPRGGMEELTGLRRMSSKSKLGSGEEAMQRTRSGRWSMARDTEAEIAKALKAVALNCLSSCHMRHAEELRVITASPESWVRIRMTEDDIKSLFSNMYTGVDGKLCDVRRGPSACKGERKERLKIKFEGISSASMTFTTASLAMLRWVTEYATIGAMVPDVLSDALSDITDIFLILVHASIDMKSRVHTLQPEPFLKVLEDLLLERPNDKTIADFVPIGLKRSFDTFLCRYGSCELRRAEETNIEQSEERWGRSTPTTLASYSNAAGYLFGGGNICTLSTIRQCVAAEGIGTFCEVLERFTSDLEDQAQQNGTFKESCAPLKLASLKSAITLGKSVQKAFYGLLAWDIIGGWQAISAVAETCRSFHLWHDSRRKETATMPSPFVGEMLSRIMNGYSAHTLPPTAAERISVVVCETAMDVVLEGFSRVQHCSDTAAASQILLDVRMLDLALVEHTGIHPCPGHTRTEMYIKATFLDEQEVMKWTERYKRKLNLSDAHIRALIMGSRQEEVPIVDQIITL